MYPPEILDAVDEGDTQFVRRWLNERTRDLNQTANEYDQSLLSICISNNYDNDRADLVQLLVANGADVRWENGAGFECLHWCHSRGEAVALLNGGADIDKQSHVYRITPLMIAARQDRFEMTRLLLRSGANLFMVDTHGNDAASHRMGGVMGSHSVLEDNPSRGLIRAVKRAGSWKRYIKEPRITLVRLRSLCARGRATPPPEAVMQRLFGAPASSTAKSARVANRPLPNEVFWHILSYWRSSRDD